MNLLLRQYYFFNLLPSCPSKDIDNVFIGIFMAKVSFQPVKKVEMSGLRKIIRI